MLEKIWRFFGLGTAQSHETQKAFEQLNAVAPLKYVQKVIPLGGVEKNFSFVCREAVLNRSERIEGYEFALERKLQTRMLERSTLIQRVYDDSMLRNLAPLGVSSLLGHRLAFIHLSPTSLNNPLLDTFSHMNVAIMITPGDVTATDLSGVRTSLRRLREMGIKHGWKLNKTRLEIAEFLPDADFIEVEATAFDGIELKMMYRHFRSIPGRPKLIASELHTSDDFDLCYHCGFDYFKGLFVSSRKNWQPAKTDINRLRVFEVLNMIRAGAEFDAIANRLRTEPLLTFKLLRYINSPGVGLLTEVDEISHALALLGRDRFYRWLSLLLFDFTRVSYHERVLTEQVLARARFMELLAGQGRVPSDAEQLFLTGLFSLLDVMMSQSISDILKQVSLPEPVTNALRGEMGSMRNVLLLAIAIESSNPEEMAMYASQCGLDAMVINGAMIEALAWVQQMSAADQ